MSINRTPKTWGTEELTSTDLNAEVKALWTGLQAAWTSYTPTWTASSNPTNYAGTGSYLQIGKTIIFWARVAANSSGFTAGSGQYSVSLPVAAASLSAGVQLILAEVDDSSVGSAYSCRGRIASGASSVLLYCPSTTAGNFDRTVTSTTPMTFAASDSIIVQGIYQAA